MDPEETLRAALRQLRKDAALTQQDLSKLLGRHQSYVSKYESGERRLDILEVRDVCLCCKKSFTQFSKDLDRRLEGKHG